MNWVNELIDLYEKNQSIVGDIVTLDRKTRKGTYPVQLVLLPIFHTTVTAQITVTIDEKGNFIGAEPVTMEDRLTIIPVTEKSASRTNKEWPHPFCDNLKYLAGDYKDYYQGENQNITVYYQSYITALEAWAKSQYKHKKVQALYSYLAKSCLIRDLAMAEVIKLDSSGKMLDNEKLQNIPQTDAFVRFRILSLEEVTSDWLTDKSGKYRSECWLDKTLQESFITYYRSLDNHSALSYLSGNTGMISYLHPKKIRNEGDGSKLISSNDDKNFTFRGRFTCKEEAFQIGYEDSQKLHNALKWIIRKQGYSWGSLYIVVWESSNKPIPDFQVDTDDICEDYDVWGLDKEKDSNPGTDEVGAARFRRAMKGYKEQLTHMSRTVLLAFDAATTGRLAMIENKSFLSSNYVENIEYWHESCKWRHVKYRDKRRYSFDGILGVDDIAELLYGTEKNGFMSISDRTELYAEVYKRLLPCICERKRIPEDLVRLAIAKASSPMQYKEMYNWEKTVSLACSFVRKQRFDLCKEEWTVALDEACRDRNYLYGRLLAVADRVEYRTYVKEERRETNAQRYMTMFAQRPMQTWKVIEEKLDPYWKRLKDGERYYYKNLLDQIYKLFSVESFEGDESLNGLYLLGYHSQALALREKGENAENKKEVASNE